MQKANLANKARLFWNHNKKTRARPEQAVVFPFARAALAAPPPSASSLAASPHPHSCRSFFSVPAEGMGVRCRFVVDFLHGFVTQGVMQY
jgi:hypothetical protein